MSEKEKDSVVINGIEYFPKNELVQKQNVDGLKYVIIRTYSAGVFAGFLKSRKDKEVELLQARRLWQWKGAASLSQLAVDGVSSPQECKFPAEVSNVELLQAIEILDVTSKAQKSIASVAVWQS